MKTASMHLRKDMAIRKPPTGICTQCADHSRHQLSSLQTALLELLGCSIYYCQHNRVLFFQDLNGDRTIKIGITLDRVEKAIEAYTLTAS